LAGFEPMQSKMSCTREKEIVFVHVDWSRLLTKCTYGQSFSVSVRKLTSVRTLFQSPILDWRVAKMDCW